MRLRLKPLLSGFIEHTDFVAEGLAPTDIAAIAYKGGLTFEQIMAVGPRLLKMPDVKLVGFHQHHGRHKRTIRYWEAQMAAYAAEIGRVCAGAGRLPARRDRYRRRVRHPTRPVQRRDELRRAGCSTLRSQLSPGCRACWVRGHATRSWRGWWGRSPAIRTVTPRRRSRLMPQACTATLRRELARHGVETRGVTLQLEPGRAMHGDTGIHLTTVKAIKRTTTPIRWNVLIVDTTEFWFTGGRYEHNLHHYLFADKLDAPLTDKADVIGRSCYGDRLLPAVPVPDVRSATCWRCWTPARTRKSR